MYHHVGATNTDMGIPTNAKGDSIGMFASNNKLHTLNEHAIIDARSCVELNPSKKDM